MDTITKGGVIWEYLKGEVSSGKEEVTKADLLKVGYSAQAIENAIAEIKKEKLAAKVIMPTPVAKAEPVIIPHVAPQAPVAVPAPAPASPAPVQVPPVSAPQTLAMAPKADAKLMTHDSDQDLMNDLSAAIKQDSKIEFEQTVPPAAKAPAPVTPAPISSPIIQTQAKHENLASNLDVKLNSIPVMPLDLVNSPKALTMPTPSTTPNVPTAPQPVNAPKPITELRPITPMPQGVANVMPMPRRKHGIMFKFGIVILVIIILAGLGSGVSYAMTGTWMPAVVTDTLAKLPFVSSLTEKYPKDKLFGVMLGKLSSIKTLSYAASLDMNVEPYDGTTPRPPKPLSKNSTTTSGSYTWGGYLAEPEEPASLGLPADFNIQATLAGSADVSDPGSVMNKNGEMRGTLSGSAGGISFISSVDFKKVREVGYMKLGKLPILGFFDLSKIEGKWIRLDKEAYDEFGIGDIIAASKAMKELNKNASTSSKPDESIISEQILTFMQIMQEAHVVNAAYAKSEKVDGINTYQYKISFDSDAFVKAMMDAQKTLGDKYGANSIMASAGADGLPTPEEKAAIDYALAVNEINVWIDAKTAFPAKITLVTKIAPDEADPAMKDKMMVLGSSVILSKINEPIAITAPTDSISAVEAYASFMGMTLDEYYEHKQESNISDLFYALQDYKTLAGEYPMTLSELTKTRKQISAEHPAVKKPAVKKGFDFAPWGDDLPILEKVPVDAFTKAPYQYVSTKKDFTLKYEIKNPPSSISVVSGLALPVMSQFVNGMNTMTSKAISVEGAAAKTKKK